LGLFLCFLFLVFCGYLSLSFFSAKITQRIRPINIEPEYDYRNRVYSATLGRFLQTDPIRFEAGDVNLMRYVENSPNIYTDPFGESLNPYRTCNGLRRHLTRLIAKRAPVLDSYNKAQKAWGLYIRGKKTCVKNCGADQCCIKKCNEYYDLRIDREKANMDTIGSRLDRLNGEVMSTQMDIAERCP